MAQWYFHTPGQAERIGPLDDASARAHAQRQPDALAWRDGLDGWTPARQLAELQGGSSAPPPLAGTAGRADEIDYRIVGNDMQFVEVELDPGESAIAEAGALMYKDAAVQMDTVFGDGSHAGQSGGGGLMGKLLSAGKRVVTGESMFTTIFTHAGSGKAKVAFAAPYPGTVLALRLSEHGGQLICQKDSFFGRRTWRVAGHRVPAQDPHRPVRRRGFHHAEARRRRLGVRACRRHGCRTRAGAGRVHRRGHRLRGRLSRQRGHGRAPRRRSEEHVFFGGEGVFLATLTGPGKVWLQSLPFSRMAGRMLQAAPQGGGQQRGEGSVLGGLGRLLDGDNRF